MKTIHRGEHSVLYLTNYKPQTSYPVHLFNLIVFNVDIFSSDIKGSCFNINTSN